jgi:hypothetical protein
VSANDRRAKIPREAATPAGVTGSEAVEFTIAWNHPPEPRRYFGTTGGQVYASADAGDTWTTLLRYLPAMLSIEVQSLP